MRRIFSTGFNVIFSRPMCTSIQLFFPASINLNPRLIFCLVCMVILPVHASWDFTPRMLVAEVYTDNRSLAPTGMEDADYISQIVPGFSLASGNSNFLLNLDYQLEGILYANTPKNNGVFHNLDLTASKNIQGDWAAFNIAAANTQSIIDSRGTSSSSNLFLSSNRTNTTTLAYGPVFRWHPRSYLLGELSFQHGIVQYDDVDNADSEQWRGRILMDATRYPGKIGWMFQYSELRTENDLASTATFRRTSADLYFHVSSRTALIGGVGWDDNRFQSVVDSKQKGGSWRVGFNWSPRRRTTISAFYNDRYFGESAEFRIRNESKYTTININYQEDFESADQGRVADLAGGDQLPSTIAGTISTEVSKVKRGSVRISRRHSKTEISLRVSRSFNKA